MSSQKKVLVIGLGGKGFPADGPPLPDSVKAHVKSPAELKTILDAMIAEASSKGFDVHMKQLADETQFATWIEEVGRVLEKEGPWDGFVIGNGIRGTPTFTPWFERLVAVGRKAAPETRMGFNTHPLDVVETIERMFSNP